MSSPINETGNPEWEVAKGELFARIEDSENFVRAVFSGRRRNYQPKFERVDIRPVVLKNVPKLQVVSINGNQVDTKNYTFKEFSVLNLPETGFANFLVETRSERFEVRLGKKGQVFSKRSRVDLQPSLEHDHQKSRYLKENDPLLIAVGISDTSGHIKPSMRDKYLQVEEFLRIVDKSTGSIFINKDVVRLVDLGCGHAYLTFAALRFFQLKDQKVSLVGVDAKSEMRARNQRIADVLGVSKDVKFVDSTISDFPKEEVDVVVALHACDTATDDALAWAVKAGAAVILAAPCCHHDLHKQVEKSPEGLAEVFDHGILTVRQMDILTDALRAKILAITGYKSEVFEFISGDHTARNLMIRATRGQKTKQTSAATAEKLREYRHTCALWGVKPALEERLNLVDFMAGD